jgi:hypothetical protein
MLIKLILINKIIIFTSIFIYICVTINSKNIKMKYLLTTIMAIGFAFTGVQAQEAIKAPQEKTLSKEEKAAAKAKKEADLMEAFKTAGLTDDEQQKYRAIMEESSAFGKALKADATLSDEEKAAKSKEYGKAKDARLKELLGLEKYRAFKEVQKAQKEAAKAN